MTIGRGEPRMAPDLVVHADWGKDPRKRWMAKAGLGSHGAYRVTHPEPVGDVGTWLRRLRSEAADQASLLIGVDFPIGVPSAYATSAGISGFLTALPRFGHGEWADFYRVAETPEEISTRRPFYPERPGSTSQRHLLQALAVPSMSVLLRRCERAQAGRRAACSLFWTLGGNQVGKAAITGWRDLLAPALADTDLDLAIWPFSGPLREVIRPGRIAVAETYPTEYYRRLGITWAWPPVGGRSGKRVSEHRALSAAAIERWADRASVRLDPPLVTSMRAGFGAGESGEDPFDALVGLCGMLEVVLGRMPAGEPDDEAVRLNEGWILGMTGDDRQR